MSNDEFKLFKKMYALADKATAKSRESGVKVAEMRATLLEISAELKAAANTIGGDGEDEYDTPCSTPCVINE